MSANIFLNLLRSWSGLFACAATDDGVNTRTSSPLMSEVTCTWRILQYVNSGYWSTLGWAG